MSEHEYQVGKYWLARDKEGGPYKINWYDEGKRKVRRKTTGSKDLQRAIEVITGHHIAQLEPDVEAGITVRQVSLKYWFEHAQHLVSNSTPRASFSKLDKFLLEFEGDGPQMLAEEWTKETTKKLIKWMRDNPAYSERSVKDEEGTVIEVVRTPRPCSDKAINRHIDDIRAAFRYCMDRPPIIQGIQGAETRQGRKKPTLSIDQVKKLFAYAHEKPERRHLQNYLVLAITTLGRPEALIDVSVEPERGQIEWDYRRLHLNPEGRKQTKKHRPIVPINDYLLPIIQDSSARYEASRIGSGQKSSGYIVEYKGKPVAGMRQTWNRAKTALGWPVGGDIGRDWDIKMLRHTMSKYLRAQGVPWPELQGHLGHSIKGQTETYAEYDPKYMGHVQAEITRFMGLIFEGQKWACTPLAPHLAASVVSLQSKNI